MIKFENTRASDQAIVWLSKMNSQNFTEQDEKTFFAWLESSPANQAAYLEAEALWDGTENLAINRKTTVMAWNTWAYVGSAACVLLVGLFFMFRNPITELEYSTAIGEQKSFILPDDSHVLLNTNSQLKIYFDKKHRTTTLVQGEIFFDVKPDVSRPFDVKTSDGNVRVLGTHFSVRKLAKDTQVVVLSGRVGLGVLDSEGNRFTSTAELGANQSLSLLDAKQGLPPKPINAATDLAWKTRQLVFRNESLENVVAELQRYYPEKIILEGSELAMKQVSGVIQVGDLQQSLQRLCTPLGLTSEINHVDQSAVIRSVVSGQPK